jgi:hypothetical protein
MASKIEVISNIFKQVVDLHGLNPPQITEGDDFRLPRLIPAGNGRVIQISKPIDDLITQLADIVKSERPQLARSVRKEEWCCWIRGAIGPAIAARSHSDAPRVAAHTILSELETEIEFLLAGLDFREYAFGTTLFFASNISPFSIGPALFQPREAWLKRKNADGSITDVMLRRILKIWGGKRQKARKGNLDNFRERDIVDAIGSSPYVCSVSIQGFAPEAGREAALTAARVALACIAMIWATSSAVLQGFNLSYDGGVRRQEALSFTEGRTVLSGFSLSGRHHGPRISDADWSNELSKRSNYFAAAGEVLRLLVHPEGAVPRPSLINALMQSLLWFYEGCREQNDLLAIVNFVASLDALGGGKKLKGILAVLKARLGVNGTDSINPGGPTFNSVLNIIYSEGRSRTIHGTSTKIGHDWTSMRGIAEQLSRHALFASLDWAGRNQLAVKAEQLKA